MRNLFWIPLYSAVKKYLTGKKLIFSNIHPSHPPPPPPRWQIQRGERDERGARASGNGQKATGNVQRGWLRRSVCICFCWLANGYLTSLYTNTPESVCQDRFSHRRARSASKPGCFAGKLGTHTQESWYLDSRMVCARESGFPNFYFLKGVFRCVCLCVCVRVRSPDEKQILKVLGTA